MEKILPRYLFIPGSSAAVPPLSTIRPVLRDLVDYAVPCVAPKWYDVGLQLDLEPHVLDEIEKEKGRCLSNGLKGYLVPGKVV